MQIIQREDYLAKLRALRDQNLIKVVTGVRRCGKSTLLQQYRRELLESGVEPARLQAVNFEDPENSYNENWHDIYEKINARLVAGQMNYIFLDEVQYIDEFERLLVGLQTKDNVDLYVTGSNSHMLSSELATLLSGRSIEIAILPFSFKEYFEAMGTETQLSRGEHFMNYLSWGGFPQAVGLMSQGQAMVDEYLNGIYETIAGRDIMDRRGVTDKATLDVVTKFLLDNAGKSASTHNIAATLGLSDYKVDQMLESLLASFLFYKLPRYDVKGKELLKTQEKYYMVDLGLRWAMLGRDASTDMGRILENAVFLELKRRGNKVLAGKVGGSEVDFVVRDVQGYTAYYQVTWSMRDEATRQRELRPLTQVKDYSPRYVLTTDEEELSHNGIRQMNVVKWLLDE